MCQVFAYFRFNIIHLAAFRSLALFRRTSANASRTPLPQTIYCFTYFAYIFIGRCMRCTTKWPFAYEISYRILTICYFLQPFSPSLCRLFAMGFIWSFRSIFDTARHDKKTLNECDPDLNSLNDSCRWTFSLFSRPARGPRAAGQGSGSSIKGKQHSLDGILVFDLFGYEKVHSYF